MERRLIWTLPNSTSRTRGAVSVLNEKTYGDASTEENPEAASIHCEATSVDQHDELTARVSWKAFLFPLEFAAGEIEYAVRARQLMDRSPVSIPVLDPPRLRSPGSISRIDSSPRSTTPVLGSHISRFLTAERRASS